MDAFSTDSVTGIDHLHTNYIQHKETELQKQNIGRNHKLAEICRACPLYSTHSIERKYLASISGQSRGNANASIV